MDDGNEALAAVPKASVLPTGRPQPAVHDYTGDVVRFRQNTASMANPKALGCGRWLSVLSARSAMFGRLRELKRHRHRHGDREPRSRRSSAVDRLVRGLSPTAGGCIRYSQDCRTAEAHGECNGRGATTAGPLIRQSSRRGAARRVRGSMLALPVSAEVWQRFRPAASTCRGGSVSNFQLKPGASTSLPAKFDVALGTEAADGNEPLSSNVPPCRATPFPSVSCSRALPADGGARIDNLRRSCRRPRKVRSRSPTRRDRPPGQSRWERGREHGSDTRARSGARATSG
jgi:hypothetical protein